MFYLSMFKIPNGIANRIIDIERRFFWGGNLEIRKLALVEWKDMEAPMNMGGLGFGNIAFKNLGLLMKWQVKYANVDNPLWKRIIKSLYGLHSQFSPFQPQVSWNIKVVLLGLNFSLIILYLCR